jgi:enediyne biosynthesis protein E4
MKYYYVLVSLIFIFLGCSESGEQPLFVLKKPVETGVYFSNTLEEGPNTNVLMYEYFYNGGGVATADFNGDGWMDLYFTSNMGLNKLYLNNGDTGFTFTDVTDISGTSGRMGPWKTGVSIVDINADGKPDIYLCYSGALPVEKRRNQLFINTTITGSSTITFEESAVEYGLDHPGYSTMAYFFDYDLDGDLDLILLNHNPKNLPNLNEVMTKEIIGLDDPEKGTRLLKNEDGYYVDVTRISGINGSELSYGLGVGIGDFNRDGWPDFYLSNDYNVPDYLYINNKDGTFSNIIHDAMTHISQFSMGNDVADFNRDGHLDIFTLDMLPEDNERQKLLMAPDNYAKFDLNLRSGFHQQFMRNMLQINNGNLTFSEVAQMAGVSNTDWSWSALAEDYNNDGWLDLFITNGYTRDYTNLDFINYMDQFIQGKGRFMREDVLELISVMPASDIRNYMYSGKSDLRFLDVSLEWGFTQYSNSNGAVFADLDNDGDLDLIVNNVNKEAFIYENKSGNKFGNYLQIELRGEAPNTMGIGTTVKVFSNKDIFYKAHYTARGFQSSVSPIIHFGLGNVEKIDSVEIVWSNGRRDVKVGPEINRRIEFYEANEGGQANPYVDKRVLFEQVQNSLPFADPLHAIRDFVRQPLLFRQLSTTGPVFKITDINQDGINDILFGGSQGQPTRILFGTGQGMYKERKVPDFEVDFKYHDVSLEVIDVNGDGLLDIYIGSGGYHDFLEGDRFLEDRIYLQTGKGLFKRLEGAIPYQIATAKGVFRDINNDGYPDLFLAGRVVPGRYPEKPSHFILFNDQQGKFTKSMPVLSEYGMVTDALWYDLEGDGSHELLVVGEWAAFKIFQYKEGRFTDITSKYISDELLGLWNKIIVEDINGDGFPDIFLGNLGLNTQLRAPLELFYGDLSSTGDVIPVMTNTIMGKSYPHVSRDELLKQMVHLRKRFPDYQSFAMASVADILPDSVDRIYVNELENVLFLSKDRNTRYRAGLPVEFQWSSMYDLAFLDYNGDGMKDFISFGNDSHLKLSLGRNAASYGQLFKNLGNDSFEFVSMVNVKGDVRCVDWDNETLMIGAIGMPIQSIRLKQEVK